MYKINAATFFLPIPFFKKIVHHFWVLEDVISQKILAELHGLATSRKTGKIVPIGYSKDHSLRAYHIVLDPDFAKAYGYSVSNFHLPHHRMETVFEGEGALEKWLTAVNAIESINKLDLNYPRCGLQFPLNSTINSNSIYRTFAEIMGIDIYPFPNCIQIGIKQSLYEKIQEELQKTPITLNKSN